MLLGSCAARFSFFVCAIVPLAVWCSGSGCVGSASTQCGSEVCAPGWLCTSVAEVRRCILPWQLEYCADHNLADGEACDNGEVEGFQCVEGVCVRGFCGDGVLDNTEQCDDGEQNSDLNPDACRTTCQHASCGDGVVDPGNSESCDEGLLNSDSIPDACRTTCESAHCGDGVVDVTEECDDNNTSAGDGCGLTCLHEACGNGYVDFNEQCDDGNSTAGDGCSPNCMSENFVCGDAEIEGGEQCDDGNNTPCDGCSTICVLEVCGNGITECDEVCDDGNTGSGDGCSADCLSRETCGNGYADVAIGEDCDGSDHAGVTCASLAGFGGGTLNCTEQCQFNTDFCYETVLSVGGQSKALAIDSNYCFCHGCGTADVIRFPLAGGQSTVLATGNVSPLGLVTDSTDVFWLNSHSPTRHAGLVMRVSKSGGAPVTLASGQDYPYYLAVDASYVYWLNWGILTEPGQVMRVPKAGGATTTLASGRIYPMNIALDSTHIYWSDQDATSSRIVRMPKAGGTVTVIVSGLSGVADGLSVDGGYIYWGEINPDWLMRVPVTGGTPVQIASNRAVSIAVDGAEIFAADSGFMYLVDGVGANPVTLVSGGSPKSIVLNSSYVYWSGNLGVYRMLRSANW